MTRIGQESEWCRGRLGLVEVPETRERELAA